MPKIGRLEGSGLPALPVLSWCGPLPGVITSSSPPCKALAVANYGARRGALWNGSGLAVAA